MFSVKFFVVWLYTAFEMWWHTRRNQISSFARNGPSPFKSARWGGSVQWTAGSRGVRISGSNAGYTMFRGSVKGTGYPLHSSVSPFTSPPVRHRVPLHFNWTLLDNVFLLILIVNSSVITMMHGPTHIRMYKGYVNAFLAILGTTARNYRD